MKRTQIQLPDALFEDARRLADIKEISLAELVRRGLEYMIDVTPGARRTKREWTLPEAHALHSEDPFTQPDWREQLHTQRLCVAEERGTYTAGEDS